MTVERTIHLFWTGGPMPQPYRENVAYIGHVNEGYDVVVHDVADLLQAAEAVSPTLAALVPTIRVPSVLSDVARLVLLLRDGGWYLDCDVQPRLALDYWASSGHDAYLFWNRPPYGAELRSNFMGVRSGHPMLERALRNLERVAAAGTYNYDALRFAGPVLVLESFAPFMRDDDVQCEEWDDTVITGIHAETRGSWQYQQCAGIIVSAERPPVFNPDPQTPIKDDVGGLNVIGRAEAFRYFQALFDEFPQTRDANYVSLLTKAAVWYVAFHPDTIDDVVAAVERYVDPGEHAAFLLDLTEQLRAVGREKEADRIGASVQGARTADSAPTAGRQPPASHEQALLDRIAELEASVETAEADYIARADVMKAELRRALDALDDAVKDRAAIQSSAAWRAGRLVTAPLRAVRRLVR